MSIIKPLFEEVRKCFKMSSKTAIFLRCEKKRQPKRFRDSKRSRKRTCASKEQSYNWKRNVTTETILSNSYNKKSCSKLHKAGCYQMSSRSARIWKRWLIWIEWRQKFIVRRKRTPNTFITIGKSIRLWIGGCRITPHKENAYRHLIPMHTRT